MINLKIPTAILIIDVQNFMFSGPGTVHDALAVLKKLRLLRSLPARTN